MRSDVAWKYVVCVYAEILYDDDDDVDAPVHGVVG